MVPTLDEVFDLISDPKRCPNGMLINIEFKVPYDPIIRQNYRFKESAQKLK